MSNGSLSHEAAWKAEVHVGMVVRLVIGRGMHTEETASWMTN